MTCIQIPNGIICVAQDAIDLSTYGSRVWMETHRYLGPSFFRSKACIAPIENPSRKTWHAFEAWKRHKPDEYKKHFGPHKSKQ